MPDPITRSPVNQWMDAHQRATDAELSLFDAELRSLSGCCPRPTAADWQRARELRAAASALRDRAMNELANVGLKAALVIQADNVRAGHGRERKDAAPRWHPSPGRPPRAP